MHRIEPHITITYPFVPFEQLPQAEMGVRQALSHVAPTRVSLRGFGIFRTSGILYLRPADPERVRVIHRAVQQAFPDYPAYGGIHGDNWEPHMTVGVFTDDSELERAYQELAVQKLFIGFDVDRVLLKYETDDDGIWDTWAEIPLLGDTQAC
jgi:2'-5' RNA ligase